MTSFIQKIAFLLLLIMGLNSCSKEVKIDIPGFDEQIVIDGSIETGTPAIIFLSNSKDIYAPTDVQVFISGATVIVSD